MAVFTSGTLQSSIFALGLLLSSEEVSAQTALPAPQPFPRDNTLIAELAHEGVKRFTASEYKPGRIQHIVLFRYKDKVTDQQKIEVKNRFLALKQMAKRSGKPYIHSIITGKQNSGEGVSGGFEQAFIVEFVSAGDRNYYVGTPIVKDAEYYDAAHAQFKTYVGSLLAQGQAGVMVYDFAVEK